MEASLCCLLQGRRGRDVCLHQVSHPPAPSLGCFDSFWPSWPLTFFSLSRRVAARLTLQGGLLSALLEDSALGPAGVPVLRSSALKVQCLPLQSPGN